MVAGIEAVHVPYKGQPEMLIDMVAGRIHYGFPSIGTALTFIKDGRLLALAMVTAKRSPQLPNVPVMTEILPTFERDASHALIAPARTPLAILLDLGKRCCVDRHLNYPARTQTLRKVRVHRVGYRTDNPIVLR